MADGKIAVQSTDSRIYTITPEVGAAGNVAITLPKEGGMLTVDAEVVHRTGDETIAGVKTLSNNLVFASGTKIQGDFSNATVGNRTLFQTSTLNSNTAVGIIPNGIAPQSFITVYNNSDSDNSSYIQLAARPTIVSIDAKFVGTGTPLPLTFTSTDIERLRIDTSGNVLVTGSGGLGYGTGSGGTVTQLTSKGTAVTLNKPCGRIIMNGASLAADGIVQFTVHNAAASGNDVVHVTISSGVSSNLNYIIQAQGVYSGGFGIVVRNASGIFLSESIVINFAIIKGAIS